MRKTYGNTWWGQQWLNALNEIDFSNRLPRGRTYANKGAVEAIDIADNQIHAWVAGSRPRPYKVELEIPQFNAGQKAQIIELVTQNALLLSKLLNRELPPALNDACEAAGVHIFPHTWSDLKGYCSCPDWAVPCKHLAAVLYLIANEIDKDPAMVFKLHRFDLFRELEDKGYTSVQEERTRIPALAEFTQEHPIEPNTFEWSPEIFDELDFSTLPLLRDNLLKLLSDQPVFYPTGNFKQLLEKAYKKCARAASKQSAEPDSGNRLQLEAIAEVKIQLDSHLQFQHFTASDKQGAALLRFEEAADLADWLLPLPLGLLSSLSEPLRGLALTFRLAKKLVEQSACVPQLIDLEDGHYAIRWLPAYLNEEVWELVETVEILTPFGLLSYRSSEGERYPDEADDFPALLSVFLTYFMSQSESNNRTSLPIPVERLFFRGSPERFDAFEEQGYPEAIHLWLSRFFLSEKQHVPVLLVSEQGDSFRVDIAVEDRRDKWAPLVYLPELLQEEQHQPIRMPVLRNLAILTDHFPSLSHLVASGGAEALLFDSQSFTEVFFEALPTIRLFGIKVLLPKALRKLLYPHLSMKLQGTDGGSVSASSIISLDNLLQFQWTIALGDQMLSPEEFREKARRLKGIVKLQDEYAYFGENEIAQLLDKLEEPPEIKPQELLQIALTEEYEGSPVRLDSSAQQMIDELLRAEGTPPPAELQATLRPYQQRGYEWLYKNARIGFGSLIADDMGLGKTLQVIATLLRLKEDGALEGRKALAILPTTLLTNWEKEIQRFAPALEPLVYHGSGRNLKAMNEADILLTTYGLARSDSAKLRKYDWLCIILDESQNIKNPSAAQTKAVKKLQAPVRIAMSGTPVENRLSEYWSVFDFTNKGYLGGLKKFKETYAKPIELERDHRQIERFRKITAPFILRRLKTDKSIIQDLPDKIEQDMYCQLLPDQAALYQSVLDNTLEKVERSEGIGRSGLILKLITALKQVCNHPRQFLKKGAAGPERSGKAQQLMRLLQPLLDNGEKALIFTQYRQMGNLLAKMIQEAYGFEAPFLHGGCSRRDRDRMVEDFQNNRATHFMLLSLKAGGTGLNLTAANNVIHYDLWWNPAVEAQATDRAYRIGQQQNVMVHRFITEATFEEKINKLLKGKKELAKLTVSAGEKWIGELSNQELRELVQLER